VIYYFEFLNQNTRLHVPLKHKIRIKIMTLSKKGK